MKTSFNKNLLTVCKFGGSSLKDAEHFESVAKIILSDKKRKIIVVSSVGTIPKINDKLTDFLLFLYFKAKQGLDIKNELNYIINHLYGIAVNLNLSSIKRDYIEKIFTDKKTLLNKDCFVSRGEFITAKILAEYLNANFIDAKDILFFNTRLGIDYRKSNAAFKKIYSGKLTVIPGFYVSDKNGDIKLLPRGGSDLSGAIISHLSNASLYENWSDTNGIMTADPSITQNALSIETTDYTTLGEMCFGGAKIIHPSSIYPLSRFGINLCVKNTNNPKFAGTYVVNGKTENKFTAVCDKSGMTLFTLSINKITAALMDDIIRFLKSDYYSRIIYVSQNICHVITSEYEKATEFFSRLKNVSVYTIGGLCAITVIGTKHSEKLNVLLKNAISPVYFCQNDRSSYFLINQTDRIKAVRILTEC